jgi:hypothetical protein
MDDKIIVTNRGALVKKYGGGGLAEIGKALQSLMAFDKKRGINSRVVYLDDKAAMKKFRGKAVANAANPRENKAAIDAVFKSLKPDYLMILGAPDVVPHQDLDNPALSPPDDDDARAWGDLPYACDAPYSRDPAHFVGPTRVLGRLPDLVSARKPTYLIALLKAVVKSRSRSADDYKSYFGLSAAVWKGSTRLSLGNTFGNANKLLLAPPSGPKYRNRQLRVRSHFINCHGGLASPEFQGQVGSRFSISLTSEATRGEIAEGTVAAVECCYGAELYDAATLEIDLPICQSYLGQGAYGYLGSTTIAYGPKDDNGAADLICQYFLINVLQGASVGRAALLARQQFVERTGQMDPLDLKTLAQFYLLGDPSVHPVLRPDAAIPPKGVAAAEAERFSRGERRAKLSLKGAFLQQTKPTASKRVATGRVSSTTRAALSNIAKQAGLGTKPEFKAFAVKRKVQSETRMGKTPATPSRYYVTIGAPKKKAPQGIKRGVAVVAKESKGRIVGYRIYYQR